MSWNYRIVKKTSFHNGVEYTFFAITEAYYDPEDQEQKEVHSFSDTPLQVYADTPEDLKWMLQKMLKAFDKEVIIG